MCFTMIDPMSSWIEIVKLPVVQTSTMTTDSKGMRTPNAKEKEPYFD